MNKINWGGPQGAWRPVDRQENRMSARTELGRVLPAGKIGALSLTILLAAVGAGSAGATLLAMSLMSNDATEQVAAAPVDTSKATTQPLVSTEQATTTQAAATQVPAQQVQTPTEAVSSARQLARVDASAEDVEALKSNDPRWAQFAKPAPPLEELRNDGEAPSEVAYGVAGQSRKAVDAIAKAVDDSGDQQPDTQETAAIARTPAKSASELGSSNIVLNTAANIRSRANKTGKVLGAVPANVSIASYGCKSSWCEISYKGTRGWVYSGFVTGKAKKQPAKAAASSNKQAARPQLKTQPVSQSKEATALPGVKTNQPLPKAADYNNHRGP